MTTERSEEETVDYSVKGGIAWVKFNRPEKRNCMSPQLTDDAGAGQTGI